MSARASDADALDSGATQVNNWIAGIDLNSVLSALSRMFYEEKLKKNTAKLNSLIKMQKWKRSRRGSNKENESFLLPQPVSVSFCQPNKNIMVGL